MFPCPQVPHHAPARHHLLRGEQGGRAEQVRGAGLLALLLQPRPPETAEGTEHPRADLQDTAGNLNG